MRLLFSIFNPVNIFYLWFNRPVSHTCVRYTFKYFLQIFGLWLILFLVVLQAVVFGNNPPTVVFSNYWLSILMLVFLMQTLSVITIPLKLFRVYLTKTSIIQAWWFIKIMEVKKDDIFAIDINKKEEKTSLHVFVADRLLGNIVMERIISDIEKGFYFLY